jgi:hypothetical protein
VRAAREAIDQSGADVLLTAKAECFLVGHHDPLRESVRRLQAFAEAGADVLFAHGPHDSTAIKALVDAVRPKPINILVVRDSGLSVADIAALGVRRISVGGALALAVWTGFMHAAQKLKSEGNERSTMSNRLSGRVCIITGPDGGIGLRPQGRTWHPSLAAAPGRSEHLPFPFLHRSLDYLFLLRLSSCGSDWFFSSFARDGRESQVSSTEKFSVSHTTTDRSMRLCSSRILPGQA